MLLCCLSHGAQRAEDSRFARQSRRPPTLEHTLYRQLSCAGSATLMSSATNDMVLTHAHLQANGADLHGGTWFETGAEMLNGGTLNYFAVPWGIVNNPLPLIAVTVIEIGLMGAVERYRWAG